MARAGHINQLPSSSVSTAPAIQSGYQQCFQLADSTQPFLICRASQLGWLGGRGVHSSVCESLNLHNNELLGHRKTNGLPPGAGFLSAPYKVELFTVHTNKRSLWHILTRHVFFLHPEQDLLLTLKPNVSRFCPAHGWTEEAPLAFHSGQEATPEPDLVLDSPGCLHPGSSTEQG